jgi:NAD(P)H-flavin reductase
MDAGSDRDLLLVAGGMGLAPLKAIVDSVARTGPTRRVDLFVGARIEEQLYDRADLERLAKEHNWLTVTFAVSADKESELEQGDVGDVALRYGPWTNRDAYVVGPEPMVEDTVGRLAGHGLPAERIRAEVFAASRPSPTVQGEVTE